MAELAEGALVTAAEVAEIIDTDLTAPRIHNFINMAVALMPAGMLTALSNCGGDATQVQLLLAAHCLTLYERSVKSQSVGGEWSVTYALKEGPGLEASLYGQMAMALDCSGLLAASGMKRAQFTVTSYQQLEGSGRLFDADLLT